MDKRKLSTRHQAGFIQGAILVGLALLVMVVAGFSLANRDAAATTGKEQVRLNASVILKQSVDLKDAIFRAQSDGATLSTLANLRSGGYLTEIPTAPTDTIASVTPVWGGASGSIYSNTVTGFGSTGVETYLFATPVSDDVCRRINAALFGTSAIPTSAEANANVTTGVLALIASPWTSRSEGCVINATAAANANVYYKMAVVR